jgi:uncharacterized membrane protein
MKNIIKNNFKNLLNISRNYSNITYNECHERNYMLKNIARNLHFEIIDFLDERITDDKTKLTILGDSELKSKMAKNLHITINNFFRENKIPDDEKQKITQNVIKFTILKYEGSSLETNKKSFRERQDHPLLEKLLEK